MPGVEQRSKFWNSGRSIVVPLPNQASWGEIGAPLETGSLPKKASTRLGDVYGRMMRSALSAYARKSEHLATRLANALWPWVTRRTAGPRAKALRPKWAPAPLATGAHQRSKPQLGWPRTTDSLCPECVKQARQAVLEGSLELQDFVADHPGEIKATIEEVDGV